MGRLSIVVIAAASLWGCGDPPICESDVFVAIQTSAVTADVDAAAPGVQADIRVRTSLADGETVALELFGADGSSLGTATAPVDAGGFATFAGLTVEAPATRVVATIDVLCGTATDELVLDVTAGAGCDLVLDPLPVPNAFYAPRDVLTRATDTDLSTPGHQSTLIVTTRPGFTVEIFEGEASIATLTASGATVELAHTIADGAVSYRATCTGPTTATSRTIPLFVDTVSPSCLIVNPAPASSITPALDLDGDLGNGIQLSISGQILGDDDVEGEAVDVVLTPDGGVPISVPMTLVGEGGVTSPLATPTLAATPGLFDLSLGARDHAGNACTTTETYAIVLDGCDIDVLGPTGAITDDADGNPGNGSQIDVTLQVSPSCAGRTVLSDCQGIGTVGGDGSVAMQIEACATSPCEQTRSCEFVVTTASGVTTSTSAQFVFDDLGPATALAIIAPGIACGAQITPATDADPTTDGVQVVARVTSPGAVGRRIDLLTGAGTTSFDATSDVTLTVAPGINRLLGVGLDPLANEGFSTPCNITLSDITVSFAPPAADGVLARADGAIAGNQITFPLCGSVSRTGTTVEVTIDGGSPILATVTGTTWCTTVSLTESPPSHTILAAATAGLSFGNASLVLRVDLTAPPVLSDLAVTAPDRTQIDLAWTSPSDGGLPVAAHVAKLSFSPITEGNFDATGTVLALGAPQTPGSLEELHIAPAITEATYFFAIATFDAAGNRTLTIPPPVKPSFVRSGAILGPDPTAGQLGLGTAVAVGRFNDDDFDDVAVSAASEDNAGVTRAGSVYIYFGGPTGISTVPDAVIESTIANGRFGTGLAAVHWSSTTRHDLVASAPNLDVNRGRLFVFTDITAGSINASSAAIEISTAAAGFFVGGNLGTALAAGDIDGDGTDDLVASVPAGGNRTGGAIIVYGDTVTGDIVLSDLDPSGANGAIVELVRDPGTAPARRLGHFMHVVGPTEAAPDPTDDIVLAYVDDRNVAADSVFVLRGDGTRPVAPGVTTRPFVAGRDVQLEHATNSINTEWGAQATTIDDRDGDGARELVISAHRAFNQRGQVVIASGAVTGTGGFARTTDAGVLLATIEGTANARLGAIILANDPAFDIDGDGLDDLLLVGLQGTWKAFVWFGAGIPAGATTLASAQTTFAAPSTFTFTGTILTAFGVARYAGDLDNDGLGDLCWATPFDESRDGSFEVLD